MGLTFGAYLKKPVTEKISTDESNDKLKIATCSMQGWRVTQEDAHNCILDFDQNTSLFSVFDGHGGHEVALYCSQKLPQYIKDTEAYKSGNYEKALIDAFLGFDATITSAEVIQELIKIAGSKESVNESSSSEEEEENVNHLYEEATMPLDEVIEKYTSNLKNSKTLKNAKEKSNEPRASSSGSCVAKTSTSHEESKSGCSEVTGEEAAVNSCGVMDTTAASKITEKNGSAEDDKNTETKTNNIELNSKDSKPPSDDTVNNPVKIVITEVDDERPKQNGDATEELSESPATKENGDVKAKGKEKAVMKPKKVISPRVTRQQSLASLKEKASTFSALLGIDELESDSEDDEEDETFEGPIELEDSSDEDSANISGLLDGSSDEDDEEEDEEDDDDDDDEEECDRTETDLEFARNMREQPGSDSGCTAVVALLHENQLFVANAGDSRCIVCRNGKAVEMSIDHKPEDTEEHNRVKKAGGHVSMDGRINGGLNLSRAVGDHAYKQNKELSDREQMITALPDVRTLTINPSEDEFMVLACDGIWNFMTSQQVVDFIRPKIQQSPNDKLSQVCEEMFNHCLAPHTLGDGTGCDNMTAIIVQFKNGLCKRWSSDSDLAESRNTKRVKTDEETV